MSLKWKANGKQIERRYYLDIAGRLDCTPAFHHTSVMHAADNAVDVNGMLQRQRRQHQ